MGFMRTRKSELNYVDDESLRTILSSFEIGYTVCAFSRTECISQCIMVGKKLSVVIHCVFSQVTKFYGQFIL